MFRDNQVGSVVTPSYTIWYCPMDVFWTGLCEAFHWYINYEFFVLNRLVLITIDKKKSFSVYKMIVLGDWITQTDFIPIQFDIFTVDDILKYETYFFMRMNVLWRKGSLYILIFVIGYTYLQVPRSEILLPCPICHLLILKQLKCPFAVLPDEPMSSITSKISRLLLSDNEW